MNEREHDRAARCAELDRDDPGWRERFAPGSHGCHEALHMASVAADLVATRLADHPAVLLRDGWHDLAVRAHEALFDLYQAIGADRMGDGR